MIASSTMVQASRTVPRSQWPIQENQLEDPISDQNVIIMCSYPDTEEKEEIIVSEIKSHSSISDDRTSDDD